MLEIDGKVERLFPELEEPKKEAPQSMKGLFDTIKNDVKASSIKFWASHNRYRNHGRWRRCEIWRETGIFYCFSS